MRDSKRINGVHVSLDLLEALRQELPVRNRPLKFRSGLWAACRVWKVVETDTLHPADGPYYSVGRGHRRPDTDCRLQYLGLGFRNMVGYGEVVLTDGSAHFNHMRMDGVKA